jgi:serine/threonine-protein kinase
MDVSPGGLVAGRYRVERRAWETATGAVWRAFDTVLERAVLIQTFPGVAAGAVGRAVARTAQVNHPGICQIYDVTAEPPAIVFENATFGRLGDRGMSALAPPQAAAVVTQLAAAISALHEHGITHGSIGPATILFDEEGRPKLTGAGLAAELGEPVDSDPTPYLPPEDADPEERDRYALGAVAYRLFTGREPGDGSPPARSVKRAIPDQVDVLLSRALARDAAMRPSLADYRRVLDPIASAEPPERGPGFFRQEARWLVGVIVVLGLAVGAMIVGLQTGALRIGGNTRPTPTPSAGGSAYRIEAVEDFDPPPGNGEEHHAQLGRVIDGKPTAWSTQGYSRITLDGKKRGVGLLFDLGEPRSVGRIDVRTPGEGWIAEWRTADEKAPQSDGFTRVQEFTANNDSVVFGAPVRARYWLLWITRLVRIGGEFPFAAEVSEVSFYAR